MELKSEIDLIKNNTSESLNIRTDEAEDRISKFEDSLFENTLRGDKIKKE